MESPLPPDPYTALGVTNSADAATIKKAYHKLALRLHPDKCTDESQKATRTDEFTKVQQAYDLIGDDERRRRYDAMIHLAELRRQRMEMRSSAPRDEPRSASYTTRTAAPRDASYSARPAARPAYEQTRTTSYRYDEDDYVNRSSTRKPSVHDEYTYAKRPSPREKERERRAPEASVRLEEERRREAKKRDAEIRDSRYAKTSSREEFEERRRDRDRDAEYERIKRATETHDKGRTSSSTERRTEEKMREAQRHMESHHVRPSMPRRESSRQVPQYAEVRRSAAPSKEKTKVRESRTSPSKEERRRAENVDPRIPPPLNSYTSSPPVMDRDHMPPPLQRTYTQTVEPERRRKTKDVSPPPRLSRASTDTSKLKRDAAAKARQGDDSGYSSPSATAGYTTKNSYTTDSGAPPVSYTYREPESARRRTSPSPARAGRPTSKTATMMSNLGKKDVPEARPSMKKTTSYRYPVGEATVTVEPTTSRSSRGRERVREPERDYHAEAAAYRSYFGEQGRGTVNSQYPREVNVGRRYRDEDINRAPPMTSTYAY